MQSAYFEIINGFREVERDVKKKYATHWRFIFSGWWWCVALTKKYFVEIFVHNDISNPIRHSFGHIWLTRHGIYGIYILSCVHCDRGTDNLYVCAVVKLLVTRSKTWITPRITIGLYISYVSNIFIRHGIPRFHFSHYILKT